jgi:murein L,D-transpeptidase YafK
MVAGVIRRDTTTRRLITETADVQLPAGVGNELRLEVRKAACRLEVWRGEERLKVYPVAFGSSPVGPKLRQGDERTPEGTYLLVPHHPSPSFGGSFYVCYPNEADVERGLADGLIDHEAASRIIAALDRGEIPPYDTSLGGQILIHATRSRMVPALTAANWTLGCIAMENNDLVELLAAFSSEDRPLVTIHR